MDVLCPFFDPSGGWFDPAKVIRLKELYAVTHPIDRVLDATGDVAVGLMRTHNLH